MFDFLSQLASVEPKDYVTVGAGLGFGTAAFLAAWRGRAKGRPTPGHVAVAHAARCRYQEASVQIAGVGERLDSIEEALQEAHAALGQIGITLAKIDGRTGG